MVSSSTNTTLCKNLIEKWIEGEIVMANERKKYKKILSVLISVIEYNITKYRTIAYW